MKLEFNWKTIAGAIVLAAILGFIIARCSGPKPPEPLPPLPPEVIKVEIVKEIPGPERIVEKVKWSTKEVEVPTEVVKEIIKVVDKSEGPGRLFAKIDIDAKKFEGLDEDGKLARGWKGEAQCKVRGNQNDPWIILTHSPIDLTESTAVSTDIPKISEDPLNNTGYIDGLIDEDGFITRLGYERRLFGSKKHIEVSAFAEIDYKKLTGLTNERLGVRGKIRW